MRYRKLGNSGTRVSAVALGGWGTFGEIITEQDRTRRIVLCAYDQGINFFDLADAYAFGKSEEMLGAVLRELPRHTLVISSKAFWPMSDDVNDRGLSRKHVMESVHKSLKRIGTEYLDIFYCHRYDLDTPLEEVVRAMDDLIHQGKVLYWGTSKWRGAQIADAVGIASRANLYVPRVEQPPYSLMRRSRIEEEILPVAEAHGIGLTTYSPLENGILAGRYDDGIPEDSRAYRDESVRQRINEDIVAKVRKLKPLADDLGISRSQLAVAWILRIAQVSSVITGATRPEYIEANAKAAEIELDERTVDKIGELFPLS